VSQSRPARLKSLLIASHFGPTVLVVSISFSIALSQFDLLDSIRISAAIFAGQLVVGWSNEVIDYSLDHAAKRNKKPLVSGALTVFNLSKLIPVALLSAVLLSFFGPLGLIGTLLHMLGLLSATLYNLKLKSTIFSPVPYIISFGALPWAIYLAARERPPIWLYLSLALFTVSFHFLNVLKDLEFDIDQGVLGLPQRIGKRGSIIVAALLAALGTLTFFILGL
jgi:4-hydroxybenzoate polyprenyltransferase